MALIGVVGIVAVGVIDYVNGVELRVVPLYYLPLSLVAWQLGRRTVAAAAVLCAFCWMGSNYLAGQKFSSFVDQGSVAVPGLGPAQAGIEHLDGRLDPATGGGCQLHGKDDGDDAERHHRAAAEQREHGPAVELCRFPEAALAVVAGSGGGHRVELEAA